MKKRTKLLALIACSLALSAHAHDDPHDNGHDIGSAGDKAHVNRTIRVTMSDEMRFSPASVNARQGETIRFIVSNAGKLKHEFVLGTAQGLAAHAEAMKKFPDMHHSAPNIVIVSEAGEVMVPAYDRPAGWAPSAT